MIDHSDGAIIAGWSVDTWQEALQKKSGITRTAVRGNLISLNSLKPSHSPQALAWGLASINLHGTVSTVFKDSHFAALTNC